MSRMHETFNYGCHRVHLISSWSLLPLINANFCHELRPRFGVNCLIALRGRDCRPDFTPSARRPPSRYDHSLLDGQIVLIGVRSLTPPRPKFPFWSKPTAQKLPGHIPADHKAAENRNRPTWRFFNGRPME